VRRQLPQLNLTEQIEHILRDLCAAIPEFAHIDPRRILVCMAHTRGTRAGGTFAKIVPMRFANATPFKVVGGVTHALPQIPTPHGEILYLIYVYFPRFFEQPFERRLLTLIHELYHIGPAFDGTIRRVGGGAHGASRERFNANLQPLIEHYQAVTPGADLLVLRQDLKLLAQQYALVGRALSIPKAIRL